MAITITQIFKKNMGAWLSGNRRSLNEGGTSSSKTYSILQVLIMVAKEAAEPFLISVVSESLPHLKRGCIKDFFDILGESQDANPRWNKTDKVYKFGVGVVEFFPADDASKMRGGRRDILFINECNNVSYNAFRELDIRTRVFTFLDWNPVSEFWTHENGLITDPENVYIHSTYLDAKFLLPKAVVEGIEAYRDKDPNWWNVYGLGLIGKVEGLVYPFFEQCDTIPDGDVFYGLDFGYSIDVSSLVRCVIAGEELYCEELIFEKGMTNDDLANRFDELGIRRNYDEIFADAAEPKSIDEIRKYGFNVKAASKGPGSVEHGHQLLRQYKQFWTKGSINCIKEQRNFRYILDKDGKLTDKTTHNYSHGMDARRYAVGGKMGRRSWGAV